MLNASSKSNPVHLDWHTAFKEMLLKWTGKDYIMTGVDTIWPWGYKTWVHSQAQNKAHWLAASEHILGSSQSVCFILSLRLHSSFITYYLLLSVSKAASMAVAKFSASSLLAKLSPYTCFKSLHWWNDGLAWLYFKFFNIALFITTCQIKWSYMTKPIYPRDSSAI